MHRLGVGMVAALTVAACLVATPAGAAITCVGVHARFPTGVAVSSDRANAVYDAGWRRPAARRTYYRAHKDLDPKRIGVICRVRPPSAPPPPVRNMAAAAAPPAADGSATLLVRWEAPERVWPQPVSYSIRLDPAPPSGNFAAAVGIKSFSLSLTGLEPSRSYQVTIIATNDAGPSQPTTVAATTAPG